MRYIVVLVLLLGVKFQAFAQDPLVQAPDPVGRAILVRELGGHTAVPRCLAFTPDGKKLISTGDDRTVQVWDVVSKERLRVIRPPLGMDGQGGVVWDQVGLNPLAVDRQGERVAFCVEARDDKGKAVRTTFVCSLETGQAQVLKHFGPHEFTPNGTALAFAEEHKVTLVKIDTGEPLPSVKVASKGNVLNLAFSPDGKTLAVVAGDAKVYLFDAAALTPKTTLTVPGKGNNLRSIGWADDHTVVCRSLSAEKRLVVLGAVNGGLEHAYSSKDLISHLPEGKKQQEVLLEPHALAGTTKVLIRLKYSGPGGSWPNANYLLDWTTGDAGKVFTQPSRFGCEATAIAPDLSIAAQGDGNLNDIILWDPKEGKALPEGNDVRRLRASSRGARGDPNTIRWRPDGQGFVWENLQEVPGVGLGYHELDLTALTVAAIEAKLWKKYDKDNVDLALGHGVPGEYARKYHTRERGIRWASGPLFLKDTDHGPEVTGGAETVPLKGLSMPCHWDFTFVPSSRVAYHPWGSNLTEVYDATTGQRLHSSRPVQSYIMSWAVSPKPEHPYLLIGSADQTLTLYNTATGKVLLTVYPTRGDWIAWTPEGYYAASPGGERLMGWHVDNGPRQLASFYPADRFRKQLYRPDVIKLLLEKGSVEQALQAANAVLRKEGIQVEQGVANLDKLLPPTVQLSVADQSQLPTVKLKVTAQAGAREQPIKSLRLFVDGRPFKEGNAAATFESGVQQAQRDWSVQLPPGKHHVAVLARSADASSVSNEIQIDCRDPADKPVMHVLAIGINDYQDKDLDLGCAANDAQLLADTFQRTCQGELFSKVRTQVLLNDKATHAAILQAIQALRIDPKARVKANDLVIIFFAGHGAKEKEQFYLLPHETKVENLAQTALSGKELREALAAFPCQVLLMMDACHSGAFGAKGKLAARNLRPVTDDATRALTDDEVGVVVMCAAMGYEKAQERGTNGLFTKAVVEALTATRDVPFNRSNHRQYLHHLQAYVFDRVTEESREKQHPFLHLPWIVESFALRHLAEK